MRITSFYAIGLFPERLEIALCRRGRIIAALRRPISLPVQGDANNWLEGVRALAPDLREMLAQLAPADHGTVANLLRRAGIGAAPRAFVFYESPSAVADCFSFPVSAVSEARAAALLSVSDSIAEPMENVRAGALVVERDRELPTAPKAAAGSPTPRRRRTHIIAAADSEHALMTLESVLEAAGLQFVGAAPVHAVIAARTLKSWNGSKKFALLGSAVEALHRMEAGSSGPTNASNAGSAEAPAFLARLHIAECGSFLLVRDVGSGDIATSDGVLRFTRTIGIGTNALVASLLHRQFEADSAHDEKSDPARNESDRQHQYDLARQALHEFGVPENPNAVHGPSGLTGREALSMMQPLLQRLVVELRQSLRFALDPDERSRVKIVISGPGATVPGLPESLAQELNLPVVLDSLSGSRTYDVQQAGSPLSDLWTAAGAWIASTRGVDALALLPQALAQRFLVARLRRALWAGTAVALLFIALDSARLNTMLSAAGGTAARALAASDPIDMAHDSELLAVVEAARRIRAAVDRELALEVDARTALQELSRLTPDSIRFTNITFQTTSVTEGNESRRAVRTTLHGIARISEAGPIRSELERFVQLLRGSPLFTDVTLANVHVVDTSESRGQRFELRCTAIAAPGRTLAPEARSTARIGGDGR